MPQMVASVLEGCWKWKPEDRASAQRVYSALHAQYPESGSGPPPLPARRSTGKGPDSYDLREQAWYHGVLARAKVNEWLTEKGDYLVRESANNATKIVLSVFVNPDKKIKISHFQITKENGQYSFEGESFDSIRELLEHHVATEEVITAKSKAVIIRGATRTERPFTHDDVKQGKRLGKGNFGDVYMGTLEDGTLCALKTCKESVPNPERFLEEADTLNQYQHPNIVQIYGVVKRAPVSRWHRFSLS